MTMYQYGPWDTTVTEHMEQLGKLLLAFTLRFCQSRNEPFKAGSESSTTLTAFEALEAPLKPTPSAAPEDSTKTVKTGTTMANKKSVPPEKSEKLKSEGTKRAGTSVPPRKPTIGEGKSTEVSETTSAAGMTGTNRPSKTTRTFKISGKSAPPAKSNNRKTGKSAPFEKPEIDATETDEIIGPTDTTRVNQKPTSSKQSGKGKGKTIETTEGSEAGGSSTATRTTRSTTQKTLPFRNSRNSKDKEAE